MTARRSRQHHPPLLALAAATAALLFSLAPAARAQAAPAAEPTITVRGDVPAPIVLTAADLAAMPRATVTATDHDVTRTYRGVWVADVLAKAGFVLGPAARRNSLSGYVLARATDGYQVLFSIGELDPAISDGQVLLADTADDQPLSGEQGRFRLVLPKDKRGARSMRLLASLDVVLLIK
ncbi:MAG: molybdopterin-dependent oxidoreductase [Gemmatimonadaceae bacterium]|nr:molybdopterin-dependent oxidoreductase [Gemmatimonadaceae bacterium]